MLYQDKLSAEEEIFMREEDILNRANSEEKVTDLPSALKKIANLQAARNIIEKKLLQTEKNTKGLESRLQISAQSLKELTSREANIKENFKNLRNGFIDILELAPIRENEKEKIIRLIEQDDIEKLSEKVKMIGNAQRNAQEYLISKISEFKEGVRVLSSKIDNKDIAAEISKLLENTNIDEIYLESEKKRLEKIKPLKVDTKKTQQKIKRNSQMRQTIAATPRLDETPQPGMVKKQVSIRREDMNFINIAITQAQNNSKDKVAKSKDEAPTPAIVMNGVFFSDEIEIKKENASSIKQYAVSNDMIKDSTEKVNNASITIENTDNKMIKNVSKALLKEEIKVSENKNIENQLDIVESSNDQSKSLSKSIKQINHSLRVPTPQIISRNPSVDRMPTPLKIEITTKKESKDISSKSSTLAYPLLRDNIRPDSPESCILFKQRIFSLLSNQISEKLKDQNLNFLSANLNDLLSLEIKTGLSLQDLILSRLKDYFLGKVDISIQTDADYKSDNLSTAYGPMIKGLMLLEKRNQQRKETDTRGSRIYGSVASSGIFAKASTCATEKSEKSSISTIPNSLGDWVKRMNAKVDEAYKAYVAEFAIEAQSKGYKKIRTEEASKL